MNKRDSKTLFESKKTLSLYKTLVHLSEIKKDLSTASSMINMKVDKILTLCELSENASL